MAKNLSELLKEKLNIYVAGEFTNYLGLIGEYKAWYQGFVKSFHEYKEGKTKKKARIAQMRMGKTVAETWASLVINENTTFNFTGEKAESVRKLIIGDKDSQRGGIFGDSRLWMNLNKWSEKVYGYAGSGLLVAYIENADAYDIRSEDEIKAGVRPLYNLKANDDTRIKVKFAPADQILPISYTDDGLDEVAIVGQKMWKGKNYIHLELHQHSPLLDEQGRPQYRISNIFVSKDIRTNELTIQDGLCGEMGLIESMDIPAKMFSDIWNAAKPNNLYPDLTYAMPMIAQACDQLAQCDIAFNNSMVDVKLGKKRVFIQQDYIATAIRKDADGKERIIATEGDELFTPVPTMDEMDKNFIKEYNPQLRTEENNKAVNAALGLLSFKCGLGKNYFKLDETGQHATAYAVKTSNADLEYNVQRQRTIVIEVWNSFCRQLVDIARAIDYRLAGELPESDKFETQINFDDGALRDPTAERERDLREVAAGVLTREEFRVRWYNETIDEAKKALESIPQQPSLADLYRDGGI